MTEMFVYRRVRLPGPDGRTPNLDVSRNTSYEGVLFNSDNEFTVPCDNINRCLVMWTMIVKIFDIIEPFIM